ncbi:MAG: hypothetical protein ACYC61_18995 [Isosphaeraceae bacterium]
MTGRVGTAAVFGILIVAGLAARGDEPKPPDVTYRLVVDRGHPWRPPFGVDRIGTRPSALIVATGRPEGDGPSLVVLSRGKEIGRSAVLIPAKPPYSTRLPIADEADELVLRARSTTGALVEQARASVVRPAFEAEAVAEASPVINPVDLGRILVPSDRLLLGPGQTATLTVAAIGRDHDRPGVKVSAWFDSRPDRKTTATMDLPAGRPRKQSMELSNSPTAADRDTLTVTLEESDGRVFWKRSIPVMIVNRPPVRPRFGATREKLRYDLPISVRDPKSGAYSTMPYDGAWPAGLDDIVVTLPGGGRFVFWRGSSYIPFWAGRYNTGACYEWAEIISQPAGAVDCVEPLMDKELRYSRVAIVESTEARVHVRWTYQSTDLRYKVWGDSVAEDYYFYPDGFGTRVVNLLADPANDYELSEFIILTPPGAYPFAVLPDNPVDALFLDGRKHAFRFPNPAGGGPPKVDTGGLPAVYRLRSHRLDEQSAVYFNPGEMKLPPVVFGPFFDRGEMVTPCYWGSHWPLARGNATGNAIDDRMGLTPCHNSVMSWAGTRPRPLRTGERNTLDTLGRSRPMVERTWAWLIGMTAEPDDRLVARAKSFAAPPSLELKGARLGFGGSIPERRAIRLIAEAPEIAITIQASPGSPCVNPVFEIEGLSNEVRPHVLLAGRPLDPSRYAWDGRVLWIDATIAASTEVRLTAGRTGD